MRVVVLGGSGFIGRSLARALLARGHSVTIPTRSLDKPGPSGPAGSSGSSGPSGPSDLAGPSDPAGQLGQFGQHAQPRPGADKMHHALWDGHNARRLAEILQGADSVVNLLGENLAGGRWTEERKERILQSRVRAGQALTLAFKAAETPPACLVQGSAVGWYGAWNDFAAAPLCTEQSPAGTGFLAETCVHWEASTQDCEALGARRCIIRTAPVLGPAGGMLEKIAPPFRFFLGGPVGSGRQPFAWIHLDDEVAAIVFLLEHPELSGVFNLAAPQQDSMRDFVKALAAALGRPAWLPLPAFLLRLALGEMAGEVLLAGQKVRPDRLLQSGFHFMYPELGPALQAIYKPD